MSIYQDSPPDEGYSEDPLTIRSSASMPPWMPDMTAAEQTDFVMSIIAHLPTSHVAEIVRRLRPRLYINFFQHLPIEVLLHILGYLDPLSLINTARASREWMALALDWKLWEQLYIMEGFRVIRSEVRRFEDALNADRSRLSTQEDTGHDSKRRATPQRILQWDGDSEMVDASPVKPSIFGGRISKEPMRIEEQSVISKELEMAGEQPQDVVELDTRRNGHDVDMTSPISPKAAQLSTQFAKDRLSQRTSTKSTTTSTTSPPTSVSSLVVLDRRGTDIKKKLNWQYLYAQRRRLEANWDSEKYVNFQLPHPNHPEEAHDECIYTIQHSGKYLVSGSRDKTVRIWDLDTRRLVRLPLRAHSGSVLCLQFDADPEQDLIVSGSSDSTVVLWRFSTGQLLQRLRRAHRESVLNVRFDNRVLVTCSKDKTIKIFNRKPLSLGEPGFPVDANNVPILLNNFGYNPPPTSGLTIKPAYTMIGCLEGHGAAVNAVQIHGDEVVSASGDRTVKVWNWVKQTCDKTLLGHTKGIACVQYDGRRIVSGSSDNEVKVFDRESGLEVASLRGHTNLVRTVQAGFGDLPYSAEEDKKEAMAVDQRYFEAVASGELEPSPNPSSERGRPRNAGSSRPEHISAYGAKLPPGGGGGRFGRIVSGSYDETIIIWRRDKEGIWRAQHTLKQEEAANSAARTARLRTAPTENVASQASPPAAQPATAQTDVNAPTIPFAPGSHGYFVHLIDLAVNQGPTALVHAIHQHPQILGMDRLRIRISALPEASRQTMNDIVATSLHLHPQQHSAHNVASSSQTLPAHPPSTSNAQPSPPAAGTVASMVAPVPSHISASSATHPPSGFAHPVMVAAQAAPAVQAANMANPQHTHHHHHHVTNNMARVFKLQFDARRIICCSQTNTIVGWDFANGDEKIIEASRFFAPIE